ncbi:DPP IV N-terminal domain-containing protein [Tundrisphaera lichenicola]|uniref:S9 family peptidase n=1 Tax=Tundrisphaera lichenicola TaxID=2029860 RepID=UPI003EC126F8
MMPRLVTLPQLGTRLVLSILALSSADAQDRLKSMPGYERFTAKSKEIPGSVKLGALSVTWRDGGKAFEYRKDGKTYRYDIAAGKAEEAKPGGDEPERRGRRGMGAARGRQLASVPSPDGTLKAFYRDRNLWISDPNGLIESAVTTDGSEKDRTKYGTASWVYGEELNQNTAFWWSPDGKKLAYYRFDESKVADYFLQLDQSKIQDTLYTEPYPKAGTPNPIADLFVYDLKSKKSTRLDVREGRSGEDEGVGYYVYNVSWSKDGKNLIFHRTNRHQNILEIAAADPETGQARVVAREEWPDSWVENNPEMQFLEDGNRFLLATVRNGWKNYDLYDLNEGKKLAAVTANEFDAGRIVRVDEKAGVVDYLAHDGDNPMKLQLHRVKLDGHDDRRLTDPALNHSVEVAPDGEHFIDVAQTHDIPPTTRLVDAEGKVLATLAESDLSKFDELGLKKVELLRFKAADGETELFGLLHKPSDFDPNKKYPVLVSVYAGPETNGARETFTTPNPLTEFGFLVASFDSRSAAGRGKKFLDAIYLKLGQVEIDDQAAGVKSLRDRSYVDAERVGIQGTSYGGYASILTLLRHPDVFRAGCASSPVTDYRHYDTIYTERYLRTPKENPEGYDTGSAVVHADDLKGRLMLYYGTADDNVHPSNTLQLVKALQKAGKSFELQVGPDAGHSAISRDRMMEFFIEALAPAKAESTASAN